jgi:predicted ATPase/transcriptional regulator with XRE-family HTH domain
MVAPRPSTNGDLLRRFRLDAGLTQEELAEKAGLSTRGVSDIERGVKSRPYLDTIARLAEALQLAPSQRSQLENALRGQRAPWIEATDAANDPTASGPTRPGLARDRDTPTADRHNVPTYLSSFVGRVGELADISHRLQTSRLVTLTGTGGCGKTRLAVEIAGRLLDEYPDGVWLVELAPIRDAQLVPFLVASTLGVREEDGRSILSTLVAALRGRRLLLVLDNCEHLVDACAYLVEILLHGCPSVRILATSREALRIAGEVAWPVPTLPTPPSAALLTLDQVASFDAVRLFVERATAVQHRFRLDEGNRGAVAQICRRLDGIPLAIELASAHVPALAVEQIADRLDERFRLLTRGSRTALLRQQTLRAMVGWSFDLLAEQERVVFRRLAGFVGGFTLDAAEAVGAGDPVEGAEVLAILDRLVAKSLVLADLRGSPSRYRLLDTIRAYGLERLAESSERRTVEERHAAYYLALAELHEGQVALQEPERDNLRAALGWFVESGDVAAAVRLFAAMNELWTFNGPFAEGRSWLARFRAMPGFVDASDEVRARALMAEARLELRRDAAATRGCAEQLLALGRAVGNLDWAQRALHYLAWSSLKLGELGRAEDELAESLVLAREVGETDFIRSTLILMGDAARLGGDDDLARARYDESRAYSPGGLSPWQLRNLGFLAVHRGSLAEAEACFRESLSAYRNEAHTLGTVECMVGFAALSVARGNAERGTRLLGAADAALSAIGGSFYPGDSFERERALRALHATLSEDAFASAWTEGQAMTPEQAVAYAQADESRSSG